MQTTKVYFEGGYQETKIYLLEKLKPRQELPGPAIIMDGLSTIVVEPGMWHLRVFIVFEDVYINIEKRKYVDFERMSESHLTKGIYKADVMTNGISKADVMSYWCGSSHFYHVATERCYGIICCLWRVI